MATALAGIQCCPCSIGIASRQMLLDSPAQSLGRSCCAKPSSQTCLSSSAIARNSFPPSAHVYGAGIQGGRTQGQISFLVIRCRKTTRLKPHSSNGGGGSGRLPQGKPPGNYISPPGLGQFRPPPTAYVPAYEESEEEKIAAAIRTTHLVEKLRDGHGTWQDRAAFVKELQQLGVTSEDLYSATFVPIVKQLEIVVAAQVYDSLVQSGTPPEILERFDESSIYLLYALRTLSAGQRRAAAEYTIQNSLGVEEAQKLAWAIKDHERRPLGREGFTRAPGDCLAFMYHRQATETQDSEQRAAIVELGLRVAVTESAKQRFSEFS